MTTKMMKINNLPINMKEDRRIKYIQMKGLKQKTPFQTNTRINSKILQLKTTFNKTKVVELILEKDKGKKKYKLTECRKGKGKTSKGKNKRKDKEDKSKDKEKGSIENKEKEKGNKGKVIKKLKKKIQFGNNIKLKDLTEKHTQKIASLNNFMSQNNKKMKFQTKII